MYLHGKEIAQNIKSSLSKFYQQFDINFVIISCGNNPESQNYIKWKCKDAEELGINAKSLNFSHDISVSKLKTEIKKLVNDINIDALILQLPLPNHLEEFKQELLDLIPLEKDVDGLNSEWIKRRYLSNNTIFPATPMAVINYLEHNNISYIGKNVAIVGASPLVGRPLMQYFMNARATPVILQSKSDLNICKNFDIVIVAAGKINLIQPQHLKKGAVVIDVGTNFVNNKLQGDVCLECKEVASYVSPVPGGVGPLTRINIYNNLKYLIELKLSGKKL